MRRKLPARVGGIFSFPQTTRTLRQPTCFRQCSLFHKRDRSAEFCVPVSGAAGGLCLCASTNPRPIGDWLDELKFDGYRALAFKAGKKVRLISRLAKSHLAATSFDIICRQSSREKLARRSSTRGSCRLHDDRPEGKVDSRGRDLRRFRHTMLPKTLRGTPHDQKASVLEHDRD